MFICDKCGSCCRLVNQNELFVYLDRGDGICKYYSDDKKLCLIYKTRPLICRIDEYYESVLAKDIDRNKYYELNYEACKKCRKLIDEEK